MIVNSYGHPIERFDPERHTGWRDTDGFHIVKSGFPELQGVPSGKTDLLGRPIMQYDPAIHVKDQAEAHLDDLRMRQYLQVQMYDGVEPPEDACPK